MDINQTFTRVKNILLNPVAEWEVIKQETTGKNVLLLNYALPFIVLIGVCIFLGNIIFHMRYFSFTGSLLSALVTMISAFAAIYISAIVINELAPSFGTQKNSEAAFKLVIYSFTAYFIAAAASSLLSITGIRMILSLCGLYSFYLLYIGMKPIMGTPEDKHAGYFLVSLLVIIAVYVVISIILGLIFFGTTAGLGMYR
jgi:hypothetical protein